MPRSSRFGKSLGPWRDWKGRVIAAEQIKIMPERLAEIEGRLFSAAGEVAVELGAKFEGLKAADRRRRGRLRWGSPRKRESLV
jgi:hypothetical protein